MYQNKYFLKNTTVRTRAEHRRMIYARQLGWQLVFKYIFQSNNTIYQLRKPDWKSYTIWIQFDFKLQIELVIAKSVLDWTRLYCCKVTALEFRLFCYIVVVLLLLSLRLYIIIFFWWHPFFYFMAPQSFFCIPKISSLDCLEVV